MEEASAAHIQVRCEAGRDEVGGGGPSRGMASPQGPTRCVPFVLRRSLGWQACVLATLR